MTVLSSSMIYELYAYHAWANDRVLKLGEGLSDAKLDQTRPMGFGSLRATLFHILAAERLWMDRWKGREWAPLETDPGGISLGDLRGALLEAAEERQALLVEEQASDFSRVVVYRNTASKEFAHPVGELLLHVANHGTHHRAQALNFLKQFDRTVPGGLDYIFFKLAYPTVSQESTTNEGLKAYGLEVESGPGNKLRFEKPRVERYFGFSDWSVAKILEVAAGLDDEALDRSFDIGLDSIRKSLLHLYDAERWWHRNWTSEEPVEFEKSPLSNSVCQLREQWSELSTARDIFISELDEEQAQRVVTVCAGGPPTSFRVIESLLQLCCHGTHHRAQVLNMLRQCGSAPPEVDYVDWLT